MDDLVSHISEIDMVLTTLPQNGWFISWNIRYKWMIWYPIYNYMVMWVMWLKSPMTGNGKHTT